MRRLLATCLAAVLGLCVGLMPLPAEPTMAAYEAHPTTSDAFAEDHFAMPISVSGDAVVTGAFNYIGASGSGHVPPLFAPANLAPTQYRWSIYHTPAFVWDPYPNVFRGWIDVRFANYGPNAFNVGATITSWPVNVTVLDGTVSLGDIPAGGSGWSKDAFALVIDMTKSQDPNEVIVWRVEYDDAGGKHQVIENLPQSLLANPGASTEVDIKPTGNAPVIKLKWEQEPVAANVALESGDQTHILFKPGAPSNAQFNPPVVKGAKKPIEYFAVVTDAEEFGNVAQVFADVYHPINSPAPYNNSIDPRGRLFKYEIPFKPVVQFLPGGITSDTEKSYEIALVNAAYSAKLISFGAGITLTEVVTELQKGTAVLWKGTALIDYEQPAGEYTVKAYAIDHTNGTSLPLTNTFTYVAIAGVEVDFSKIVYGSVSMDVEKMIAGDTIWDANPTPVVVGEGQTKQATVRNIGNTWAHVTIMQNDMGFGKDVNGQWNVMYDARMGSSDTNKVFYAPNVVTTLPNFLKLSTQDELDLSIKVHKAVPGKILYGGAITIGATIEPFPNPP